MRGGAYMLAGELAAADWDPAPGFAGYQERMRSYVEANQEIGRMHVQMLAAPDPDAGPAPEPDMDALNDLIDRAVNGPELPTYEGVPDSGTTSGAPTTPGHVRSHVRPRTYLHGTFASVGGDW